MMDKKEPRADRFTWKEGDIHIIYSPPKKVEIKKDDLNKRISNK